MEIKNFFYCKIKIEIDRVKNIETKTEKKIGGRNQRKRTNREGSDVALRGSEERRTAE